MKRQVIAFTLATSIALSPVGYAYATPKTFSGFLAGEVKRLFQVHYDNCEKEEDEIMKQHERKEAKETTDIFNQQEKEMTRKQVDALKHMLDDITHSKGKVFKDIKSQKRSIKARLQNKRIIWEDHRALRHYLDTLPNLEGKTDKEIKEFAKDWVDLFENPYSDINHKPNKTIFVPIPSLMPVSTSPVLAY